MTTSNQQELLNKPVAPIAEIPPAEISKASEQVTSEEVAFEPATPEGVVEKRQEISLEGQAAMVKNSLDKIKSSFVNWKQAILDSKVFSDDELPGIQQWFVDSFNRFQSIEQIIITELSLLQTLKSDVGEESAEMIKISNRLSNVNETLRKQEESVKSLLTSLMTIREGLSAGSKEVQENYVSSMKIVFKAMNDLSRKYLSSMDKAGLERDLSEEELLLKANNPEQFKAKMAEKKLNLNLLYNCYDSTSFFNVENSFVPADVYFEKESLFLADPENKTLQSLVFANGDLEKTRKAGSPLIPENLRQFYMLKAVFEDSAERYQLLSANFTGIESLMKILSVKKISSLDNYDLPQYTLSAFQSNIGRLLSENKAAEIPAYLQKNLNDLNNIIKYLEGVVEGEIEIAPKEDFPMPKIASVEVSDLDVPASAESKGVSVPSEALTELAPSSIAQGEIEVAPNADFALPKMASVEVTEDEGEIMNADDLLEEVTKEKYKMPPSPAIEKTKLLESFWKAEDTFKQVVSRKVELGVSSDLKLIDNIKNTLIENGILEVEGVSLSAPEFTIDFNSLQTELWSGINNLIVSGLESKKEFSEIESEINKYISKKREGLVLLKEKLQKAITPFIEFRKNYPDVEQLMEVNINSKLVAKVNAIANLVKNQFLKAGIEEVDGINLLALSEIYDGGAAATEFKNEARLITEQELAKGSSPEEVFAALNKFISRTDDKLRNLYKLLLENVPGRVVDRESQLVADFWKNQPGLANRVRYYETMFDELKKSADEKVGGSVSDDMSKKFRNNLNQSLKDALSQQKTEAEIIKLLEDEFKHADEIIDTFSVDVFLKKDKPQPAEDVIEYPMDYLEDVEEVVPLVAKPKYSMPSLRAMKTSKQAEQKSPENRELSLREMISGAKSFDELAELIQKNQIAIQGSEHLFTTEELLVSVNLAKEGIAPQYLQATRTDGFREKLYALYNEQRAKKPSEGVVEMGDENIISSEDIKNPEVQEPISLTEDMKKPVVETQKVAEAANWRQEAIVGPHERMLYISSLIKDLIKSRKNIDQKRELIDIDEKFNRLADSSDNPETMAAWEQFQADNKIETEDPLAYFVDEILDLNGIRKWREAKNDFQFSTAVDTANVRVSNFMNALGLSDGLLPTRRSSVDARTYLGRGRIGGVQMPGNL